MTAEPTVEEHTPAEWGEPRSRTVTWHDPLITAAGGRERSGLETMRAIRDGVLPPAPIGRLLQMEFVDVEEGRVEFRCAPLKCLPDSSKV